MSEKIEPGYWAVIPAPVRYDTAIPANAKLLYAELSSLAKKKGFCYASNAYFSEVFSITDGSVRRLLKALSESGYISVHVIRDEKTHEVLERRIYVGLDPNGTECTEDSVQKRAEASEQKSADPSAQKSFCNNRKNNKPKNNPPISPQGDGADLFERFWVWYRDTYCAADHSRAGSKAKAKKAWDKLKVTNELAYKIRAYLESRMRTDWWKRGIGIPYASSFLNSIAKGDNDLTPVVPAIPLPSPSAAPVREEDQWL